MLRIQCILDPCESSPCQQGGTCVADLSGSFQCICSVGYRGPICNMRGLLVYSLKHIRIWCHGYTLYAHGDDGLHISFDHTWVVGGMFS